MRGASFAGELESNGHSIRFISFSHFPSLLLVISRESNQVKVAQVEKKAFHHFILGIPFLADLINAFVEFEEEERKDIYFSPRALVPTSRNFCTNFCVLDWFYSVFISILPLNLSCSLCPTLFCSTIPPRTSPVFVVLSSLAGLLGWSCFG